MFDFAAGGSAWVRAGVTALLVVAPTVCFLAGYRLLAWLRHDELAERAVEEGYAHPGLDDFLSVPEPSGATAGPTVTCDACDRPTVPTLGNCHVCGERV